MFMKYSAMEVFPTLQLYSAKYQKTDIVLCLPGLKYEGRNEIKSMTGDKTKSDRQRQTAGKLARFPVAQ